MNFNVRYNYKEILQDIGSFSSLSRMIFDFRLPGERVEINNKPAFTCKEVKWGTGH